MIMTGIVAFILKPEFPLLKYTIVTITALYIVFSFSHPDYLIAKYNYGQNSFSNESQLDSDYLYELCGDAAPAILDFTKQLKEETVLSLAKPRTMDFQSYFSRIYSGGEDMDARTFNLSKYLGKKAATEFLNEN